MKSMGNTSTRTTKIIENIDTIHVIFHEEEYLEPYLIEEKHFKERRTQSVKSDRKKTNRIRFLSVGEQRKEKRKEEINIDDSDSLYYDHFKKDRIERIIGINHKTIVYNTRMNDICQRDLITNIRFKKDLILLCMTSNKEIIGCSTHNPISSFNLIVDKLFIISSNKTQMIYPKHKYSSEPDVIPLNTIYNNSLLLSVYGALWISDSLQLTFNPSLNCVYNCYPSYFIPKKPIKLVSFVILSSDNL